MLGEDRRLSDAFGREITDLRISVTNRCNFSCIYCHDEGLGPVARPGAPRGEEMLPAEVERIVSVGREFGVRAVKFTGGEPLIRSDLEEILARTVRQIPDVSLTTNGSMLAERAETLRAAGLKRVNVSIDALDPEEFRDIRHGNLAQVLRGVRSALDAGLTPVKINVVLGAFSIERVPELIDFVRWEPGLKLQLIQFMPEYSPHPEWRVDLAPIRAWLEERADRVLVREAHHRRVYLFDHAEVELVDPVDNPEFCMNCHRIRVTHRGELKGCLNRNDDLQPTRGLTDAALRAAFRKVATERVPYYGVYQPLSAYDGLATLPMAPTPSAALR
jgi:cyclic pyranopterin phosphate synthase